MHQWKKLCVAERKIPTDFIHVNEFCNVRVVVAVPFYD